MNIALKSIKRYKKFPVRLFQGYCDSLINLNHWIICFRVRDNQKPYTQKLGTGNLPYIPLNPFILSNESGYDDKRNGNFLISNSFQMLKLKRYPFFRAALVFLPLWMHFPKFA